MLALSFLCSPCISVGRRPKHFYSGRHGNESVARRILNRRKQRYRSLVLKLLEEALQMVGLIVEELDLLLTLLSLNLAARSIARLDSLNLALQLNHFVRLLLLLSFKLCDALLKVGLAVLSLELLAHGEGNRTTK